MLKAVILGAGSIGQRHFVNLRTLRPDAEIGVIDPPRGMSSDILPDIAIIASPTNTHDELMRRCAGIPFFVEKPLGTMVLPLVTHKCSIDTQYRFHAAMPAIREAVERTGVLHFHARDDLLSRYGPDVDGVMAAHPIDTALWLLGPALSVGLVSDGVSLRGKIEHERGYSTHDYRMDSGPRVSTVTSGKVFDLDANNEMYLDALGAWLGWVEGGERDPRTCILAEGLAVMDVLAKVKHVERA